MRSAVSASWTFNKRKNAAIGFLRISSTIIKQLSTTTIINDEVEKFDKIGSDWWDPSSRSGVGPLHSMNPVRVSFIRQQLARKLRREETPAYCQLDGLNILDVGCGGGLLSESLSRLGANVTGIDPSPRNIKIASIHSNHDPSTSKINYINTTIEEVADEIVSSKREKYDVVCALEVIEHVKDPQIFIENCLKSVKPGGSLFLSTMNRTSKSYLMAILGAEYVLGLLPPGTHDWNKFISPNEMKELVRKHGGRTEDVKGLVLSLTPFTTRTQNPLSRFASKVISREMPWAISETDFDVNYILHAVN